MGMGYRYEQRVHEWHRGFRRDPKLLVGSVLMKFYTKDNKIKNVAVEATKIGANNKCEMHHQKNKSINYIFYSTRHKTNKKRCPFPTYFHTQFQLFSIILYYVYFFRNAMNSFCIFFFVKPMWLPRLHSTVGVENVQYIKRIHLNCS